MFQAKNLEIASLQYRVVWLETQVQALQINIDDNDAYERRNYLFLPSSSLLVFETGEICTNLVWDLVTQTLQINLSPSEISIAHCLEQRPQNQGTDKRNIIAKFLPAWYETRHSHGKSEKSSWGTLRQREPDAQAQKHHQVLRRMKKSHPSMVKGVTTYDGRVSAFKKPAKLPLQTLVIISDQVVLTNFCREYIKSSLDETLERVD